MAVVAPPQAIFGLSELELATGQSSVDDMHALSPLPQQPAELKLPARHALCATPTPVRRLTESINPYVYTGSH